jgi:hypothetical protein
MNARIFSFDADMSAMLARENDAADDTARYALRFMQSIPQHEFTERVALAVLSALQSRVSHSTWSHTDHGIAADEYLTDAHLVLENAADAQTQDAANEDTHD